MPDEASLPETPGYEEVECAKAHGGWPVWERLPVQTRARLLAHERLKAFKDHYYRDMMEKQGRKRNDEKRETVDGTWDVMQRRFFNGPPPKAT